ncbi:MAG TPA: hypothetical protein VFQ45_09715 [Longimicrobium sp.]|nr:hypothetical protein [Longimicrobium sp.]
MPALNPGQTVVTGTPDFLVDALPPGTHRFQLVVEDDSGNESAPVERVVTVFAMAPQPQTTVPLQPQVLTVQPQPAVVSPTPRVTATPTVGIRFPTSTLRASAIRLP